MSACLLLSLTTDALLRLIVMPKVTVATLDYNSMVIIMFDRANLNLMSRVKTFHVVCECKNSCK